MDIKEFISDLVKKELQDDDFVKEMNDIDVGHVDDEPGMIKQSVFEISEYALELYKLLDQYDKMEQEIDFPHWWQSKIVKARDYIGKAKDYLEFQTKEQDFK